MTKRLATLLAVAALPVGLAAAGRFEDGMMVAATLLTLGVLAEAAAAAGEAALVAHAPAILSIAGTALAAGGAANTVVGLTLIGLVAIGVVGVVVVAGTIIVAAAYVAAPTLAAAVQARSQAPTAGVGASGEQTDAMQQALVNAANTPPSLSISGTVDADGNLTSITAPFAGPLAVTGRGLDLDDPALDASGLAPGDIPGPPGPCCPGTGLSLELSLDLSPVAESSPAPEGLSPPDGTISVEGGLDAYGWVNGTCRHYATGSECDDHGGSHGYVHHEVSWPSTLWLLLGVGAVAWRRGP